MSDTDRSLIFPDLGTPAPIERRNHLLVIGVDGYDDARTWPALNNAEYDAQAFAKLMTEKYRFSLLPQHQLLGQAATREEILEQFESFTAHGASKLTEADNLLVYFAGHGDIRGTRGFWIPRDASARVGSLVSHDDIWGILRDIHAHHIYLIADACFAGDFVRSGTGKENSFADNADLFPSRRVLTSGRSGQTVKDGARGQHSPFARVLLSFLSNSPEPEFPAIKLELHAMDNVPRLADKQQPISAYLHGLNDQKGQMVFRREVPAAQPSVQPPAPEKIVIPPQLPVQEEMIPEITPPPATKEERIAWGIAEATNTLEAYQQFLAQFPKGHFSQTPSAKLDALDDALWEKIPKTDEGYRKYLDILPNRKHSEEAQRQLRASAKQAWTSLNAKISVEGLRDFLKIHPDSEYSVQAQKELDIQEEITFQLALQNKNPHIYIKLFSSDFFLKKARIPLPEMILIRGGEFMMGSKDTLVTRLMFEFMLEGLRLNEMPSHKVKLSDFYLGKYPLTFEEYDAYCEIAGVSKPQDQGWGRGKRPVINISWDEAYAYCAWLKELTGQDWRLPTEAEWEYAAGGGMEKRTKWAGTDQESELGDYAWYNQNADNKTHPVGERKPNALGLYDMSGNVWEWCSDWHGKYPSEPQTNPLGPVGGEHRVSRGGSWGVVPVRTRVSYRLYCPPGRRDHRLGFRLARSL